MTTRVQRTDEGPARTRVTIRPSANRSATPAEVAAFITEHGRMTKGWTGSFDTLEALLTHTAREAEFPWTAT